MFSFKKIIKKLKLQNLLKKYTNLKKYLQIKNNFNKKYCPGFFFNILIFYIHFFRFFFLIFMNCDFFLF